jgi:Domain of unknown function (DUF4111)
VIRRMPTTPRASGSHLCGPSASTAALPAPVQATVEDLLARLDRELPGRIEGFYVVGSTCLGAFRDGRSDVDFVAVLAGELEASEARQLRAIHRRLWLSAIARDGALRRRWPLVCNGSYLTPQDLSRSPLEVTPQAGHVSGRFGVAQRGFDVNPVTWHTLARRGIAVRGPEPESLHIRTDAAELRTWTVENLNGYWRRWANRARRPGPAMLRALPRTGAATPHTRRFTAWGVLGSARLHYTLLTGEIASKEDAGYYALEAFAPSWRPLIEEALGFWRGARASPPYRWHPDLRRQAVVAFVAHVIESANRLPSSGALPRRHGPAPDTPARAGGPRRGGRPVGRGVWPRSQRRGGPPELDRATGPST